MTGDEKEDEVTQVVFRKFFNRYTRKWEVLAFLPGLPANPGNVMCYQHEGQHGEASLDFYWHCRRCEQMEYEPLKREMEGIGYRFKIVKSITKKMREEAWGWSKRK